LVFQAVTGIAIFMTQYNRILRRS